MKINSLVKEFLILCACSHACLQHLTQNTSIRGCGWRSATGKAEQLGNFTTVLSERESSPSNTLMLCLFLYDIVCLRLAGSIFFIIADFGRSGDLTKSRAHPGSGIACD